MPKNHSERATLLLVGIAVLACLVLASWWLDTDNAQPNHDGIRYRHLMYSVQPATVEDWMTFNYLNSVFLLPPLYLAQTLGIQDPSYPNLSIRQYAVRHGLDTGTVLAQVRSAISALAQP